MSFESPPAGLSWGRTLVLLAVTVIVQATVFDRLDLGGLLHVDAPLLVVVAISLRARIDDAAVVGFGVGVGVDLLQLGPFGQHALIYCTIGAIVAASHGRTLARSGAAASAAASGPVAVHRGQRPRFATPAPLLAATVTVVAGVSGVAVRAALVPLVPDPASLVDAVPLGSLAGSAIGMLVVGPVVARLAVGGPAPAQRRLGQISRPLPSRRPARVSPVRRL